MYKYPRPRIAFRFPCNPRLQLPGQTSLRLLGKFKNLFGSRSFAHEKKERLLRNRAVLSHAELIFVYPVAQMKNDRSNKGLGRGTGLTDQIRSVD
jgi:hypothetical protein